MTRCAERARLPPKGSALKRDSSALRRRIHESQCQAYRDAILDATEMLLSEEEPRVTKVTDIAAAAGISVGTVYNHFKDKKAVFAVLLERLRCRFFCTLEQSYSTDNPLTQLEEFVRRSFIWLEQTSATFRGLFSEWSLGANEPPNGFVPRVPAEWDAGYAVMLEQRLRRAINAGLIRQDRSLDELSWYLRLLLRTAVTKWIRAGQHQPLSETSTLFVKLFFGGAASNGRPTDASGGLRRAAS